MRKLIISLVALALIYVGARAADITNPFAAPYFSAFLSANQTGVTTSTFTKLQFNTKTGTASGQYDGVTNFRFTPTTAGTYHVTVSLICDGTTISGNCIAAIYKNGTIFARSDSSASGSAGIVSASVTYDIAMNGSTDFVEGFGRVTCASACLFDGGSAPTFTWISASFISP